MAWFFKQQPELRPEEIKYPLMSQRAMEINKALEEDTTSQETSVLPIILTRDLTPIEKERQKYKTNI